MAMSVFCQHCRKRLILEDYTIKSYQAVKGYATCGDIVVEKKGRVFASIQAGNLTVRGIVQGEVRACGKVSVSKSGTLMGSVTAHTLAIEPGASLDAVCRIEPQAIEEEGFVLASAATDASNAEADKSAQVDKPAAPKQPAVCGVKAISTRRPRTAEQKPAPTTESKANKPAAKRAGVKAITTRRSRSSTGK